MIRLTKNLDEWECRAGECKVEDWIEHISGVNCLDWEHDCCDSCPFMVFINKLAEYEDKEEANEKCIQA